MRLLSSADLFKNLYFQKSLSGTLELSECQTIWIQIRTDRMRVQTVCKGYQQTAKVATSRLRVNSVWDQQSRPNLDSKSLTNFLKVNFDKKKSAAEFSDTICKDVN